MTTIQAASPRQAEEIAGLIMIAMDYDCCRHWAGAGHTLEDFRQLMVRLVSQSGTQYSLGNCLVAMDGNTLAGVLVSYDGGQLHRLREAFVTGAKEAFGKDYSSIEDETSEGEFYLDSLAVKESYRHQGIASALISAAIQRASSMGIPRVGLLVDKGNPVAESLYHSLGFRFVNDTSWGGHPMRHLQLAVRP